MQRKWVLLAVAILVVVPALSWAETKEQSPPARLEQLVSQLGSAKYKEREAAMRELDALGTAAVKALEQGVRSTDPEVCRRSQELLTRIDRRVQNALLLAPKKVRLQYKDTPVNEAVADFAKKTGMPINADALKGVTRKITLQTEEIPFWEAFEQLCKVANLVEKAPAASQTLNDVYRTQIWQAQGGGMIIRGGYYLGNSDPGDGRVTLAEGKPSDLPSFNSTNVRIRALPPTTGFPGQSRDNGETLFGVEVTPEPGMQWLGVLDVRLEKVVDDKDQKLTQCMLPTYNQNGRNGMHFLANGGMIILDDLAYGGSMGPTNPKHVPIRLRAGDQPSKSLKELKGIIAAQVQTPYQPLITVDNPLEAAGKSFKGPDGMVLKVISISSKDGKIQVKAELEGGNPMVANNAANMAVMLRRQLGRRGGGSGEDLAPGFPMSLVDEKGQPYQLSAIEPQNVNGNSQDYSLTFQAKKDQGAPVKLIYSGQRTVVLEVPFQLKDVQLP